MKTIIREVQKSEAIRRLKILGLLHENLKEFMTEDVVCRTESDGVLFYVSNEEQKLITDFENKYNSLVFHVCHTNTEFGLLYSLLYVSSHREEWDKDITKIDINVYEVFSYVINVDCPEFSEFGYILIKNHIGGLVRIA